MMNKFKIINLMQKAAIKQSDENSWCLVAGHKHETVSRVRTVSFIIKTENGYLVTRTGVNHNTFMSALASLIHEFIHALRSLITSMLYDDCAFDSDEIFYAALNGKSESTIDDISPFRNNQFKAGWLI